MNIIKLISPLHNEEIATPQLPNHFFREGDQVIYVMTGGTEGLFVDKIKEGVINLINPVYLVASGQSNSLAASLEILAYINQHGGKGKIIASESKL